MRQRGGLRTFVDWYGVGNTVSRIHNNSGGSAARVQRQHRLYGHVHCGTSEGFEHDLRHLFSVDFGIQGRFRQENRMILRGHPQFVVKSVVPNLFHVVPIVHNPVLDWVLDCQNTPFSLSLVSYVRIFLAHANHHALTKHRIKITCDLGFFLA
jgi:hypothetical protein